MKKTLFMLILVGAGATAYAKEIFIASNEDDSVRFSILAESIAPAGPAAYTFVVSAYTAKDKKTERWRAHVDGCNKESGTFKFLEGDTRTRYWTTQDSSNPGPILDSVAKYACDLGNITKGR